MSEDNKPAISSAPELAELNIFSGKFNYLDWNLAFSSSSLKYVINNLIWFFVKNKKWKLPKGRIQICHNRFAIANNRPRSNQKKLC